MNCPYFVRYCSKCKNLLLVCPYNFAKHKTGKYGFKSICKRCVSIEEKKRHHDNKDKINKRHRKNYHNNIEKERKRSKDKYERNKDKILEHQKEYRLNNLDKVKEQERKKSKKWRDNHPEQSFNHSSNRRLKEKLQGNGLSNEQFLDMMNYWNWTCAYSGHVFSSHNIDNDRTIDHITPLNKNGEHEIWNMIPMYANYNYSKQDKDMLEWYKQQEFYSEERLQKIYEWQEYAYKKWSKGE